MLGFAACGGVDVADATSGVVTLEIVVHADGTFENNVPDIGDLEQGAPVRLLMRVMGETVFDATASNLEEAAAMVGHLGDIQAIDTEAMREELLGSLSDPYTLEDAREEVQVMLDLMNSLPSIDDLEAMTDDEADQAMADVQARIRDVQRELNRGRE